MYYPNKQEFMELAKRGNVIPVFREIAMGSNTPLSSFLKIDEGKYSFLLESVEGGERLARYSILGTEPSVILESKRNVFYARKKGGTTSRKITKDPIEEVKKFMSRYKYVPINGLPRFSGGLVGYIGYDMVRFFEKIPDKNPDDIGMPDMVLMLADTVLVFDHVERKIKVIVNAFVGDNAASSYEKAKKAIDGVIRKLKERLSAPEFRRKKKRPEKAFKSNFTSEKFCGIVKKAKERIKCGDIIQVVLSQRLERETSADAFSIYRALRSINPSPYMFYLKLGGDRLVGSSPEILVRCEEGLVETRPIAGTRRRGSDDEEDKLLEKELLADPKERAEHIMLLDLGRNDIGRVCEYSSVRPREIMTVERYSHVMHIVSDVTGKLRKDRDIYDVLRAAFPAGTVTGAPKVKAMELIEKFENKKRGPYAGSVGYISFSGNMDMCITIRTILMRRNKAYIQAGAGIVLDSEPEREYEESINKARAMMKAVESAEDCSE